MLSLEDILVQHRFAEPKVQTCWVHEHTFPLYLTEVFAETSAPNFVLYFT